MPRPALLAPHLALVAVLLACPRPAAGCATVTPKGQATTIQSESALLVYDAATQTEHFIRTASFQSTSAEFGFLVPTPTKPDLGEASADVFAALGKITERRTEVRTQWKPLNLACGSGANMVFSSVGSAIKPGGGERAAVRVVERKRVGDFDAVVLQASDPKSLHAWLTGHGFDSRPTLEEWFKPYTANNWFLTAFKIAADSPAAGGQAVALTSTAVRISFRTDRPIYPYREPADPPAASGPRALRLFVLSDERVGGTVGSGDGAKAWAAKTEWSNRVPADKLAAAVSAGKLPAAVGERDWHLTELFDESSPRRGTDELYLNRSDDQSAVERPPLVRWEERDPWPWLFGGTAALMLVSIWLRSRQDEKTPTPPTPTGTSPG